MGHLLTNRYVAVAVGVIALMVGLGIGSGEVSCGAQDMAPGDTCVTTNDEGVRTETSYSEERDERRRSARIAYGVGALLIVGGLSRIIWLASRRGRMVQPESMPTTATTAPTRSSWETRPQEQRVTPATPQAISLLTGDEFALPSSQDPAPVPLDLPDAVRRAAEDDELGPARAVGRAEKRMVYVFREGLVEQRGQRISVTPFRTADKFLEFVAVQDDVPVPTSVQLVVGRHKHRFSSLTAEPDLILAVREAAVAAAVRDRLPHMEAALAMGESLPFGRLTIDSIGISLSAKGATLPWTDVADVSAYREFGWADPSLHFEGRARTGMSRSGSIVEEFHRIPDLRLLLHLARGFLLSGRG